MNDLSTTGQANALGASATDNSQPREHLPDSDGSLADQDPKQEKGIDSEQVTKKKSLFARPWSRKQLGGIILMTENSYQLYHSNHDDPSYKVRANHPVYAVHNFPDPGLLQHNGTWYAFGTNPKKHDPNTIHIPVATSSNFVNWTLHDDYDAMPTLGGWERSVNHWAPDAIQRDDGKFVIYYSGQTKNFKTHHCIGAAVSKDTDPLGPYIPLNESLACPHKYGGAIDPSPFKDIDGKLYVVYKGDGNSVGSGGYCGNTRKPRRPVPLILQELESDGITKIGEPKIILDIDDTDGPLIEAPDIIRSKDGVYYLFFSSHCFTSLGYNVKYAHARSLKGPYTRADRPLLQTTDFGLEAPGGASISKDGTKMVFHAKCGGWRCMFASGLDIRSGNNTIVLSALDFRVSGNHSVNGTEMSVSP
ncbi:hypothetical protein N7450_005806 [Penicillium hetheringtonii]|uniref:Uncharacterized protein n=1 Tax=Penicillium hetheringtonii TaxID=911720 RepID=A0AAD6DJ56_9EURO|nr:hypothetical protein N7450_005806 [Penicillium hetheringtonii]